MIPTQNDSVPQRKLNENIDD